MEKPAPSYRRFSLFAKKLGACVEPITRPALKKQGLAGTKIITQWDSIVGEKLASHCIPQKLAFSAGKKTDGTLTIAVENGFATEMQHLQPIILERLATYFGYKAVARITIANTYVQKISPPPPKPANKTLTKDCIKIASQVKDEELRTILTSIAKQLS